VRPRVALATYARTPGLAPDDRLLLPAFAARGVDAQAVVWSDDAVKWESFGAVVIRSCWDYHLRFAEFNAWLDHLESIDVRVYNSPTLVRWNANKRYLLDLAQRDVPTVPTTILSRHHPERIDSIIAVNAWSRLVIKPAVSASGYETYALHTPLDAESRSAVARVAEIGDALVQPFIDEISRSGEYSFTFIDGEFSHATIKRAAPGEFRVQTEHGGTADPVGTSSNVVAQAARVLATLPEKPLYARVDGVVIDNAFLLMELELIEPNLFLEFGSGAAERMAAAIVSRLAG